MFTTLPRTWLVALACLLALLAGPAFALGLGQINVRSQAGEPLLAEIPIISSDPSELENLRAGLASPETFARIGLDPPDSTVSGLQFSIALDPRGNPVVRVTSQQPIRQPLLTFLIEVDWGQGRLVREYSALLDTPNAVAAPAQPPIQAPSAPSNAIVRAPQLAPDPAPVPLPTPEPKAVPPAAPNPAPAPTPPAPMPPAPVAQAPREAPAAPVDIAIPTPPAPAPASRPGVRPTAQPVASTPGEYGPVKAGDTLGRIAGSLGLQGFSIDQTMLALLRANPEAFIDGNVNLIKRGAVLKVPGTDALAQLTSAEARTVVNEQVGRWRELRAPAPQPVAVAGAANGSDADAPSATSPPRVRTSDARLEIVPPSANAARQAGTTSGIKAGGEGDMLRQELQQTKETLAARDAEVQELKTRVADLEKLQQQQQQLMSLKDGELAEAQQTLATTNASAPSPPANPGESAGAVLWPWLVLGVVIVLLGAWLLMRRKAPKARHAVFDSATLAAGLPTAGVATDVEPITVIDDELQVEDKAPDPVPAHGAAADGRTSGPVRTAEQTITPTAGLPNASDTPSQLDTSTPPPVENDAMPTWHSGSSSRSMPDSAAASADAIAPLNAAPAGRERLELARAYMDLGDVDTARTLLQEVADGGDAASRGEAARLLRNLA